MPKRVRARTFGGGKRPRKARRKFVPRIRAPRPEIKKATYDITANAISDAGASYRLSGIIAQGTDYNNRIGRKIFVRWINVRLAFYGSDTFNIMRCWILKYRNGVPAAVSDLIPVGGSAFVKFPEYSNVWVYRDKMVKLQNVAQPNTDYLKVMKMRIPVFKTINYTGSAINTDADGLWFAIVSDSSAINHPTVTAQFTLTYTDA